MKKERPLPAKKWVNCCRGRKNCPKVAVDMGLVWIKDDDGNEVQITLNQLDDIVNMVKTIQKTRGV